MTGVFHARKLRLHDTLSRRNFCQFCLDMPPRLERCFYRPIFIPSIKTQRLSPGFHRHRGRHRLHRYRHEVRWSRRGRGGSDMASTAIVILLHTHMPYVRRNGDWPVGEEWLLEAWAESYLPLWRIIEDLTAGTLPGRLSLTMTPILAEQLQDEYMEERLDWYLKNKINHTRGRWSALRPWATSREEPWPPITATFTAASLADFDARFRGRMMQVLVRRHGRGVVEVLASAATHAHLPSLGSERHGPRWRSAWRATGAASGATRGASGSRSVPTPPTSIGVLAEFSPPLYYVVLDLQRHGETPAEARTWEPQPLGDHPPGGAAARPARPRPGVDHARHSLGGRITGSSPSATGGGLPVLEDHLGEHPPGRKGHLLPGGRHRWRRMTPGISPPGCEPGK